MNELIQLVASKTGLSEAHARLAVETVLGYLKTSCRAHWPARSTASCKAAT